MESNKWTLAKTLFLSIILINSLNAQICEPPIVDQNTYGLTGIGDGCTIKYTDNKGNTFNAAWILNISLFKGTFTSSCDRHDKCLTQIGNKAVDCNNEFYSNMKNACNSKYPWYRPVERNECNHTALQYFGAVSAFQSEEKTADMQKETVKASMAVGTKIDLNECASSPERLNIYSNNFINEINNAFLMYAGRVPTLYEFMNVANSTSYIENRNQWRINLNNKAIDSARDVPPPVSFTANTDFGLTLSASQVNGANYLFKVSGFTSNNSFTLVQSAPMYNQNVQARGFLQITNSSGVKNVVVIDANYLLRGECSPRRGIACY